MLYIIGLGLGDELDITVNGLNAVKTCDKVFLDHYTSILGVDKDKLVGILNTKTHARLLNEAQEELYGREVILADRELVESNSDDIVQAAVTGNSAFLVVGDVFGATTHADIWVRAREANVQVKVIHNASIMNAVGCCGLQLYNFGQTVSVPFFTDSWKPESFYDKMKQNMAIGLHTLCLVDIKVKEQSVENMLRGRKIYEPPRFMTVNQCIEQLMEVEEKRQEKVFDPKATLCVGLARVGQPTQQVVSGTMEELLEVDFGPPLHSFIVAGDVQEFEREMLDFFHVGKVGKAPPS